MAEKLTTAQIEERIKLIDDSLIVMTGKQFDGWEISNFIDVCNENLHVICSMWEYKAHVGAWTEIISEENLEKIREILEKWDGVLG